MFVCSIRFAVSYFCRRTNPLTSIALSFFFFLLEFTNKHFCRTRLFFMRIGRGIVLVQPKSIECVIDSKSTDIFPIFIFFVKRKTHIHTFELMHTETRITIPLQAFDCDGIFLTFLPHYWMLEYIEDFFQMWSISSH